jgi:hypothetical protein
MFILVYVDDIIIIASAPAAIIDLLHQTTDVLCSKRSRWAELFPWCRSHSTALWSSTLSTPIYYGFTQAHEHA